MKILNFLLRRAIGRRTEPTALAAFILAVLGFLAETFGLDVPVAVLEQLALALAALALAFLGDRVRRNGKG